LINELTYGQISWQLQQQNALVFAEPTAHGSKSSWLQIGNFLLLIEKVYWSIKISFFGNGGRYP